MTVRQKKETDFRPVVLKFGVGLAISLGGILCAVVVRCRSFKPPKSKASQPYSDLVVLSDARNEGQGLGDDDYALESSCSKNTSQSSTCEIMSNGGFDGNKDGLILPEFVKKHSLDGTTDYLTPVNILETHAWDEDSIGCKCTEIVSLQNQVKVLEERERYLEFQLLEYYGLKEQETAVMELQNWLKIKNTEAKHYNLKIESLELDKRNLEARVSGYANVVAELEAANAKIQLLRKKLRIEAQQNREQILSIQERVMNLQDGEIRAIRSDQDVEMQQGKKELELELEETKNHNRDLKTENSELAQKLEFLQMLTTSALDNEEGGESKEENQCLRKQNTDLEKEIEQLQADRCTDLEELVYLRWVNACLRYELRNYQPHHGKALARDLSRSLSHKSEKKAKQLILEYANAEASNTAYIDSDHWSTFHVRDPSQASTDPRSSRTKVFAKLMKLLRGKDYSDHIKACPSPMGEAESMDDAILHRFSSDSQSTISDALTDTVKTSSDESSLLSLNLRRSNSQGQKSSNMAARSCNSSRSISEEDGSLDIFRTMNSAPNGANDSCPEVLHHQDAKNTSNSKLVKYAQALNKPVMEPSFQRGSARFNSS